MTITPIDLTPRADNASKIDTLDVKNEQASGPTGPGFGQVMNQLRQIQPETGHGDDTATHEDTPPSGQEMAAGVQDMSHLFNLHHPEIGSWSLKAVNLGPTLNVITPDQAVPDAQSLEAFARSQGLDENAVQWLMGKPLDSLAPAMQQPADVLGAPASNAAALNNSLSAGLNLKMAVNPASPMTPTGLEATLSPALAESASPTAAVAPVAPVAPVANLTPASSALTPGMALWAMALSGETGSTSPNAKPVQGADNAEAAAIQIQLMRQPTPAAVWMLRNAMPLEVKPERAAATPSIAESELDLSAEISPEWVDSLLTGAENSPAPAPMSSSGHPGAMAGNRQEAQLPLSAGLNNTEAAETPGSNAAERSENIQNLAEKMGQAVGRRMLTEIEKGQWHLKLQLRPATLGHIEVEMRMLSGELDAVFNAPQALTRELLQEGMSRLKDTLNQMGMDVASMQVKDGQTRQNGGKSTPNQASKSTDLVNNDSKSTNSPIITVARQKMGEDGWDVLV